MNPLRFIFAIVLIALISAFFLVKFYITQRNFTAHHKEFTLALNAFESQELQLKHALLENSLSAYQNIDPIAEHINALTDIYEQLLTSQILEDENYFELKNQTVDLPFHEHPVEHLVVVLEGIMEFIFQDKKTVMKPKDSLFVPANTRHTARVIDGPVKALEIYKVTEDKYYNR